MWRKRKYKTKKITKEELTSEYLKTLLAYNEVTGEFKRKISTCYRVKEGDVAGQKDRAGYVVIKIHSVAFKAHQLAFLYMNGKWPIGEVDHVNGIKSDNSWINLRDVSKTINQQNRGIISKVNSSGYTGVIWDKRSSKWLVTIRSNNKFYHIGYFKDLQEAVEARQKAKDKYHLEAERHRKVKEII